MLVATIAILSSQGHAAPVLADKILLLGNKGSSTVLQRWWSETSGIPNMWAGIREPSIPNAFREGDLLRYPIPTTPPVVSILGSKDFGALKIYGRVVTPGGLDKSRLLKLYRPEGQKAKTLR